MPDTSSFSITPSSLPGYLALRGPCSNFKNIRFVGPAFRNKIKITDSRVMLEKRKFFVQEKPMDLRVTPAILVLQVTLITPSVSVLEYYLVPRRINSRLPFGRQRNMQKSNTNTSLRWNGQNFSQYANYPNKKQWEPIFSHNSILLVLSSVYRRSFLNCLWKVYINSKSVMWNPSTTVKSPKIVLQLWLSLVEVTP